MKITDKAQPRTTAYYVKTYTRMGIPYKRLKKALQNGRRSIKSLRPLYNTLEELYTCAQALDIKQTYLDGEWYWELYKDDRSGPFSFKPIAEL